MEVADRPSEKKKARARNTGPDFWGLAHRLAGMSESERIQCIKTGFPIDMADATKTAFGMTNQSLSELLHLSVATYERRKRDAKPLDSAASERLDRIAGVTLLAEEVFEDQQAALEWMSAPNEALGGNTPVMNCETAIGAQQVRRILNALEWGGAA